MAMNTRALIFDTETTGLPAQGMDYKKDYNKWPYIVSIAWYFNGEYRHEIIKPEGWTIPENVVAIHGITTDHAIKNGRPFIEVISEFIHDCTLADVIVAHNIFFDTSMVKANVLRMKKDKLNFDVNKALSKALSKEKRIDTKKETVRYVNARYANGRSGKWPSLIELHEKLFGKSFPAHNALEDVKALKRCVDKLEEKKIISTDKVAEKYIRKLRKNINEIS